MIISVRMDIRMSNQVEAVSRLNHQLDLAAQAHRSVKADPAVEAARGRLRDWQAARLRRTHKDLLASARTEPAASFFLTDLYGSSDLSKLADDVRRIVPVMVKLLPTAGLETVADGIELHALSEDLDIAMVAALGKQLSTLDAPAYGRAYRKVGRRKDRQRQIDLVQDVGQALARLIHQPFVATALGLMRKPAKLAGLGALQDFLQRGYEAFRKIDDPQEFLDTIVSREQKVLQSLFAKDDSLLSA